MRKMLWYSALLGAGALLGATGCRGRDNGCPSGSICIDAQGGEDAGPPPADTGTPDAGRGDAGPCPLLPGRQSGAACGSGDMCLDPLQCQTELAANYPGTQNPDGTPGPAMPIVAFPGSMCATICDPEGDGSECNSDCEACNGAILEGRVRFGIDESIPGVCRPRCTPSMTDDGCSREGYACDVLTGTCMERCVSDEQCKFGVEEGEIVYRADSMATCNTTTGRCDVPGNDAAVAGDPCTADTDCEDNGFCLGFDGDPDGYCSRLGCAFDGFECNGTDEVCDTRSFGPGYSACLEGCTVGAEQMLGSAAEQLAARRGSGGGNPTCDDPGYACFWNGSSDGTGPLTGSCLPGNYNDEPAYDVGTACITDADCFSPFGYGRCLFANATDRVQSGICAIGGCLGGTMGQPIGLLNGGMTPLAIPTDVQNEVCNTSAGDVCVGFGGDTTFCMHTCDSAADCPAGYACPALLTGGTRICWPNCVEDEDCHTGATCRNTTGGACAMGQQCFCSDAMPAPIDAGTPDAGADGSTTDPDAGADGSTTDPDAGADGSTTDPDAG